MNSLRPLLCVFIAAIAACSSRGVKPTDNLYKGVAIETVKLGTQKNVFRLGDQFWVGGQPSAEDLPAVKSAGIRTLVNLRATSELPYDEAGIAGQLDMGYVNIPVNPNTVSEVEIDKIVEVLANPLSRPVFLHDGSGNRAAALWTLYRIRHDRIDMEVAILEGQAVGMTSPKLEEVVRAYAR